MAEVIGVVAAGVGFVQLAASITKLKDLLQEFKDAPNSLLELIRKVDGMTALLSELAIISQDPSVGPSLLSRSTVHCRDANDQLLNPTKRL